MTFTHYTVPNPGYRPGAIDFVLERFGVSGVAHGCGLAHVRGRQVRGRAYVARHTRGHARHACVCAREAAVMDRRVRDSLYDPRRFRRRPAGHAWVVPVAMIVFLLLCQVLT